MTSEPTTSRPVHWVDEHRKQVAIALVMLLDMSLAVISDLSGGQLTAERGRRTWPHAVAYLLSDAASWGDQADQSCSAAAAPWPDVTG